MSLIYKAFYDRQKNSIEGFFTLQGFDPETKKVTYFFKRLHARSGQKGFENTDWVRAKSPIPYGDYSLWLDPLSPGQRAGVTGIGEFYQISSGPYKSLIQNPNNVTQYRQDIGLHEENKWPGSAGCIVLVENAPDVFELLRELSKLQDSIPLKVL